MPASPLRPQARPITHHAAGRVPRAARTECVGGLPGGRLRRWQAGEVDAQVIYGAGLDGGRNPDHPPQEVGLGSHFCGKAPHIYGTTVLQQRVVSTAFPPQGGLLEFFYNNGGRC